MARYSVADRIDIICRALCGDNQRELAWRMGITPATLSRLKSGEKRFTSHYADKIFSAFPELNRRFVEYGDEEPGDISIAYVKERYTALIAEKDSMIKSLLAELDLQREIIRRMK